MAAPYSKYLSNFRTTLPRRSKRTTFNALKRLPIPCKQIKNYVISLLMLPILGPSVCICNHFPFPLLLKDLHNIVSILWHMVYQGSVRVTNSRHEVILFVQVNFQSLSAANRVLDGCTQQKNKLVSHLYSCSTPLTLLCRLSSFSINAFTSLMAHFGWQE